MSNELSKTTTESKKDEHIITIPSCEAMPGGCTFKFSSKKEAYDFYSLMMQLSHMILTEKFFKKLKKFYESVRERIIERHNEELQKFYEFIHKEFNMSISSNSKIISGLNIPANLNGVSVGPGVSIGPNVLIGSNASSDTKEKPKGLEESEDDGLSCS